MAHISEDQTDGSRLALSWYFHLLFSWSWLIVLAGVAAGGLAYFVAARMPPTYRASTRLLVSAPSTLSGLDPSTGAITIQTLTTTYSQMVLDRSVLEGVIQQLQLQTTPEQMAQSISAAAIPNTQLLEITVEDTNPQRAANIANAVANLFAARVQDLRSQRYSAIRDGLALQIATMEQQIATTSDQIAAQEQEMAAAAANRAAGIQTQLAAAATQTVTAMGAQPGPAATQTITAMQQQIVAAVTQTAAAAAPTTEPAALVQLQARLTQYRSIYSNLVLSYEQVRLAEEQTSTNVVVSEPASVPVAPIGPKKGQYTLLGLMLGMAVVTATVIAAEALDDTVRDPEDIRKKLGLPILGIITRHRAQPGKPVALAEPRSPAAEAFRLLRTNITYAAVGRPLRRLLITSATPLDGKTTVACSLAAVLSQNEKRVLLLDADLRRPQVHHKFGLVNRLGLSDLFVQRVDNVSNIATGVNAPGLAVITAGELPPNPAELLASGMMGKILDALSQDFDTIIIDSPPVLSVADAAALAPSMDGVVLVARTGATKLGALRQAVEQLRAVGARVLGVVLNGVDRSSRKYGYYYSQYYPDYSHYYEPERTGLGRLLRRPGQRRQHRKPEPATNDKAETEQVPAPQAARAGMEPEPLVAEPQRDPTCADDERPKRVRRRREPPEAPADEDEQLSPVETQTP